MNTKKLFDNAMKSPWGLKKLNFLLKKFIPFNSPHKFQIIELTKESAVTKIPYIRKNLNHLKGLHACCLATATEYTCGIVLGNKYGLSKYRLIMKSLEMEYHYQGKMDAFVAFKIPKETLLLIADFEKENDDKLLINCEVKAHDKEDNLLSTGKITWQIKKWDKVKTKQ